MHFSFTTIVTVALIVSTSEAIPRNVHVFDRSEPGAYRALPNRARVASGDFAHKSFPKLIVRADDDDEDISKTSKANATTSATSDATATGDAPSATTTGGDASAPASSAAAATGKASGSAIASAPAASGGASGSSTASAPTSSSGSTSGNSTTGTMPASAGQSTLSEPMKVTGVFDGGMVTFDRGVECTGQTEGDDSDAVFDIQAGGTLKNVIIGANQKEGVHCQGSCTLENVWWEAVCEDAFTIKVQDAGATTTITGGGASGAEDKVLQHNGGGTLKVSGFTVDNFGKLYRACGNCKESVDRHVELDNIKATGGTSTLVGINHNFGDTAKITNSCITGTKVICEEFEGTTPGNEPKSVSTGPSDTCVYTDADINAC